MPETKATRTYRKQLIEKLNHRRADLRTGSQRPVDQNGAVIMQSNMQPERMEPTPSNTVSILATRGALGELTRMIHFLEEEEKDAA